MKAEIWRKRISNRSDISKGLVHLTRESEDLSSFEVLMKILKERTLVGSTNKIVNGQTRGFICGNQPVVCFQDVLLSSVSENVLFEQEMKKNNPLWRISYKPFGLRFDKRYIYRHRGRPVIYEDPDIAKTIINPSEHWRIVKLNLEDDENLVDWTFEREWRMKGDFHFDLKEVEILLSDQTSLSKFYEYCEKEDMLYIFKEIRDIVTLKSLIF